MIREYFRVHARGAFPMNKICQYIFIFRHLFGIAACAGFLAWTAGTTASFAAEMSVDINASCRIPFEKLKDPKKGEIFPLFSVRNESVKISQSLRLRYIVGDFNSADENGNCRGVQEYFSTVDELSDFPRLQAIAAASKTDVASLAKETLDSLLATEGPLLVS